MNSVNKPGPRIRPKSWMVSVALGLSLLLALSIVAGWVSAPPCIEAENGNPFFDYLIGRGGEPALIAFNPSNFDPQRPWESSDAALASLREDLRALAPHFDGLVLYETLPGLSGKILATAKELGFRAVLLGIWNPKRNEEIQGVAELVRQFHGQLALAVVIGNEGLISNRYTLADIQGAAAKLRALLPAGAFIPFTTSEPIGEYGLSGLRDFGEFLAPNIHPAVDQDSVESVAAAEWVRTRAQALARVGEKPILVKETGLPNGGPGYTPALQKTFWAAYLHRGRLILTDRAWVSFAAAFEAYDMPWKAEKSRLAIEGHWGLLNAKRRPYPGFEVWRRGNTPSPMQGAKLCR